MFHHFFLPVLSYSHAPWRWNLGKERLLPYQVNTTQGTPTPVVRTRRLPGARCTLHDATPTGRRPYLAYAGNRGAGAGGANPTEPCVSEKTVAAVWRIPSLHLSKTEGYYLTPHLVKGVL